jgi:ADP-L-glycero-D-manno-heptose 6-epimerase
MHPIQSNLHSKKILITGGAGFIGSNLAFYFQKNHPEAQLTIFDCFRTGEFFPSGNPTSFGDERNLEGFTGQIIHGDITSEADLGKIAAGGFDIVFHEAAISDTTVEDEALMFKTNTEAFLNILKIARTNQAKVIYASSAGTYGNSTPPNQVGHQELPTNIYGASKLAMDELAQNFVKENPEMHVVGLRYFNVFGPKEYLKGKTASMILQLGLQVLKHRKVRLFKYGEQKRDFIYIEDVVQANVKGIDALKSGIYNVGTGVSMSFNDIVECLKNELGEFEVEYFDNPYSFYQNHTEADISNTRHKLQFEPAHTLALGIQKYIPEIKAIHENKMYC